jgi:hypothetical protein
MRYFVHCSGQMSMGKYYFCHLKKPYGMVLQLNIESSARARSYDGTADAGTHDCGHEERSDSHQESSNITVSDHPSSLKGKK